jgi:hypothetical protein
MDTFADLMPSRFYKTEDVADAPIVLTIKSITKEDVEFQDRTEKVAVIRFDGTDKGIIGKSTTLGWLRDEFGTPQACVGKTVELYKDPNVMMGSKKVGGLRLRQPSGDQGPAF